MKVSGREMLKFREYKSLSKVYIRGILKIIKDREKVSFIGAMENTILDNGRKEKNLVAGIGSPVQDRAIWENGLMVKSMAMVFIQ